MRHSCAAYAASSPQRRCSGTAGLRFTAETVRSLGKLPGGIFAVVAVSFGAGGNTTSIVAVQGLRVLVMVLLAPVAVRWPARDRIRIPSSNHDHGD